jgi:hypothetical protein
MRKIIFAMPLLFCAAPSQAQSAPQLPPELTSPATMQRLTGAMQALSDALLNLKVGEVRAAMEGRPASPAERNTTIRDLARRDDPAFDRHLHQRIAGAGVAVQQSAQALNRALPEVMGDLEHAQKSLERAIGNLPDPNYPIR